MNNTLRTRAKASVIKSKEELLLAICAAAEKQLERDEIMLLVERRQRAIREELLVKSEGLDKEVADLVKKIQKYSTANRKEIFGDKQSVTIAGHSLEFRKSPGRTAALKGYTLQDVVDALLVLEDEALSERLTSVKATLAKDEIMKFWEKGDEQKELLKSLGVEVIKDETFKFAASSSGKTGGPVSGEKEAPHA